MSNAISINNFLCDVESKDVKIDNFNMENIIIYKYVASTNRNVELVRGNFDKVYDFLDREYWLDNDVRKVIVGKGRPTEIEIDYICDCPILSCVIDLRKECCSDG